MRQYIKKRKQGLLYIVIGVINTAFGYSLFAGLTYLHIPYRLALLIATVIGVTFNFFTYGKLVFNNTKKQLIVKFFVGYAILYFLNIGFLDILLKFIPNTYIAQLICIPLMAFLSYWINKTFVFSPKS